MADGTKKEESSKRIDLKSGGTSKGSIREVEENDIQNNQELGESSRRNNSKPEETSNTDYRRPMVKCEACETPVSLAPSATSVKFRTDVKCEACEAPASLASSATSVKFRTDVKCEACEVSQRSSRSLRPSDEDERFFGIYPSQRESLGSWLSKISSSPWPPPPPGEGNIHLQREMRLISAINFVVLVSVGTGVYVYPSIVLERTGSVTESLMVWLICGVLSLLIAITYGELVFVVSQSGARFGYLLTAFSPFHKFFGPLPAFITTWIGGLFLGPAQVSLTCLILAENFYLPTDYAMKTYTNIVITEPVHVKQAIGLITIGLVTLINSRSLKFCISVQHIFGVLTFIACTIVIGGGFYSLSRGNTSSFDSLFRDMKGNSSGIVKAMYQGMWTYEGWSNVVTISEEMKDPLWTIPRAVLVGLPIATFLHLFMNVATLSVLTPKEIVKSSASFLFLFEEKLFGTKRVVSPLFFAISAVGSAMCIQLGVSRTCFAAAREGHMPKMHTYLDVHRFVPLPALITQAIISALFVLYVPIIDLIEYSTFITWTFYGFDFIALIILRIRLPDTYRLYKTPLSIPVVLSTVSILVTFDPIFRPGGTSFYLASSFTALAVFVYYFLIYKEKTIYRTSGFNKFVRTALNVAPPSALPEGYSHSSRLSASARVSLAERMRTSMQYYK